MSHSCEEWGSQAKPKSMGNKIKALTYKIVILSTRRDSYCNHYLDFLKPALSLQLLCGKLYILKNTIEPSRSIACPLLSRGIHINLVNFYKEIIS